MRSRSIFTYIFVALLLYSFASCENPKPKNSEALISKAFYQKVEAFKIKKREECLDGILVDAEVVVDSIIAQQLNLDTIDFPRKPIKPNRPDIKEVPEEFDLVPIR